MKIQERSAKYNQQLNLWTQIRAAIKGKYAVDEQRTLLPKPQYSTIMPSGDAESQARYNRQMAVNRQREDVYWFRGRFFNATGRTQESLDGMIWSKQPEMDIQSELEFLIEDADSTGCGLREVAQEITDEVISVGRYGILVDMPKAPVDSAGNARRLTRLESESRMYAPRFVQYKAEQIISYVNDGDAKGLDEVMLAEMKSVRNSDGEWEKQEFVRQLVIEDGIYHNKLYGVSKKGTEMDLLSDDVPRANGRPLDEIPFQFFGADNNSPEYSKPPLYDLASANLGHYVLDCENRDNLHYHGQGLTVVYTSLTPEGFFEMNPSGLNVGAKGVNQLAQGDKVELLQIAATGAIQTAMERDEQRMIYLGAQLVQNSSSTQTLGAKEIEANASMSTLKRIAYNVSSGIEQCMKWAAGFLGVTFNSAYKLNTEFLTDKMDAQTLALHFQTVQSGLMPKSEYWAVARKAGLTKKTDEELEELTEAGNLDVEATDENTATIQARLDAALEEIERLNNA